MTDRPAERGGLLAKGKHTACGRKIREDALQGKKLQRKRGFRGDRKKEHRKMREFWKQRSQIEP